MAAPPLEIMLGSASWRQGGGALRRHAVLGRGAPLEMVRVGLMRRVAWPKKIKYRQRSQNCGELADGAQLVLANRGEGCSGIRVGQGINQVAGSALGVVGGRRLGHAEIVWGGELTILAMCSAAVDLLRRGISDSAGG